MPMAGCGRFFARGCATLRGGVSGCVRAGRRTHASSAGDRTARVQSSTDDLRASRAVFDQTLTELRQNESIRRARELWKRAREDVMRQNAALVSDVRAATEGVRRVASSAAGAAAEGVARPLRIVSEALPDLSDTAVGRGVRAAEEKVRAVEERVLTSTDAYQYGGFRTAEQRARVAERLCEETHGQDVPSCAPNEAAGTALVATGSARGTDGRVSSVSAFLGGVLSAVTRPVRARLGAVAQAYAESTNVFAHFARAVTDRVRDALRGLLLAETEAARAHAAILQRVPSYRPDVHVRGLREVVVPAILEAMLANDRVALRRLCTDGMHRVASAALDTRIPAGCRAEGRVLDLRGVDVASVRLLEDGTPVVVLTMHVQQTSAVRRLADNALVSGSPDAIESVVAVMAFGLPEASACGVPGAPVSAAVDAAARVAGPWRLMEMAVRDRNGGW